MMMGNSDAKLKSLVGNLFSNKPLTCVGEFLTRLNENTHFPVLVKEAREASTAKILMSNPLTSSKWGLTPQEMVGHTSSDVFDRVKNFRNKDNILKRLEQSDQAALAKGQSAFTYTILGYNGIVSIQNTVYVSVYNHRECPVAIFAASQDLTRFTSLTYLFEIYKQYYASKKEAISHFWDYLQLATYFYQPLSHSELTTLLLMVQDTRHKVVSKLKGISRRTVEAQCAYLKDKLRDRFDLHTVITYLKDLQKWKPEIGTY